MNELELLWYSFSGLVILGVTIGIVLAVIFGAIRIGWNNASWIFIGAFIIWSLSVMGIL